MTAPKPLSEWQEQLPLVLPRHVRRNIAEGPGGCWLWLRSRSRDGYGWASLNNKSQQAHRLTYSLIVGEPPAGLVLDHLCRVRHCVSPAHLEPVTPRETCAEATRLPGPRPARKVTRCLNCEANAGASRAWRSTRTGAARRSASPNASVVPD